MVIFDFQGDFFILGSIFIPNIDGSIDPHTAASITRRVSEASRDVAGGAIAASFPVILLAMGGFPETAAADTPAWVGPTKLILDPILLYFEVAFIARIVLSWYPTVS